jgi:hypothetical protein
MPIGHIATRDDRADARDRHQSCAAFQRFAVAGDSQLPIRHERKAFTEIILGDFLVGLGTASADSNSDPESVGYLNLMPPSLQR